MAHNVIIVGGGFAGVRTALLLANDHHFKVKLITERSYFEYHAALYRSATGRSPLEVAIPLADFFRTATNIEVVRDKVVSLDPMAQTATGESWANYPYDSLVLALGNVTQYFGIEGLEEYAYEVKTIQEALKLKRHLHEELVEGKDATRHYVVVGAGPTGVELAAELVFYLTKIRKRHQIDNKQFTINLLEAGPRVLSALPEAFSVKVLRRLKQLGVKLYLDTPIKAETLESVKLPTGEIKSHTVIWTAGVANNPLFKHYEAIFKLAKTGKVKVNLFNEAAPNIYVLGDSANTPYSGMAQTAIHDANQVAINLKRKIRHQPFLPYRPKRPIYAIPVGPGWSAVLWGKLELFGYLGWVIRRLADLRLYLIFLPLSKALTVWRYGIVEEEECELCK